MDEASGAAAICRLVQRIRDLVNAPWKHYELRQNKASFYQVCAAMDVIDDTEQAITGFEAGQLPESLATLYLAVYGVLQALVVQQDAALHLARCLGVTKGLADYPGFVEVRDIRNDAVGHPTQRDRKSCVSYNQIARVTLSRSGFELFASLADGRTKRRFVDLAAIIGKQRQSVRSLLLEVECRLEAEAREHTRAFREEKLSSLFPRSISYHCDKVVESVRSEGQQEFGAGNLRIVQESIASFRGAVGRRDMDLYEQLGHSYALIHHAIESLCPC